MGKLTGRTLISANINENLLIHVVDTTGTPASFKANFSQLYGIFPKNASAGAGDVDYLARWTSANELGKGIVQDDGTALTVGGNSTINGKTIIKNSGVTSQLELHKTGESLIYFYDDAGTGIQSYLGSATVSTSADTFRIFHQGSVAIDIDSSHNVDIPNGNLTVDGTAILQGAGDAKLKLVDFGTSNNNRIEFIDTGSSVRGYLGYTDANTITFLNNESSGDFVFDGYQMTIKSGASVNALVVTDGQNVEIPNGQIKIAGGSPAVGKYLKSDATGLATWDNISASEVTGVVTATSGANNQVAVFDGTDSIEGDSKFTWNGSNVEVNLGNEYSRVNADYFLNLSESDNANLFLYSKSAGATVGSEIVFGRWNGTVGFESPLIDNQLISAQTIKGSYDSANPTNIVTGAQIQVRAAGAWTTSNYGVIYTIDTATEGSTTVLERFRINSDGNTLITGGLGVNSTSEGLQMPRWTSAQETTNTSGWGTSEDGTIWFNTDTNQFMGWNGSSSVILG